MVQIAGLSLLTEEADEHQGGARERDGAHSQGNRASALSAASLFRLAGCNVELHSKAYHAF